MKNVACGEVTFFWENKALWAKVAEGNLWDTDATDGLMGSDLGEMVEYWNDARMQGRKRP